jgi:phage gp29-like protein
MTTRARKQRLARRALARDVSGNEAENSAPILKGEGPLTTSAEALRMMRQVKHNPLPNLTPQMLSRALDSYEHGYLREAVILWEKIAERDDVITSVKPKREKDVSQLDMQVTATPESGEVGAAHKEVLEKFWKSCRAVNAYDRNEKGRFRRLIKQMMTAVSYRYAAHHIIWEVRNGELRATFEFVPLWMFENRTGTLRYLKSPHAQSGEILADGEWMVTVGDGLMIAASIGYLAKRSAYNDWLIFSEKFSVPGTLGRTPHKKGSPEGEAMREAVESFGHDFVGVIYGDDGTHAKPIEIIQAQGNPSGMPMPAVIERVDKKFAAMWRGADLSSMSSGKQSHGTGASLQEKETDILRRDDAETICETLAEVSRLVIEWQFGNGVEPLAQVELIVPVQEDAAQVLNSATTLADRGAEVSTSSLMDRLAIQKATTTDDVLGKAAAKPPVPPPPVPGEQMLNSDDLPDDDLMAVIIGSMQADLQPLGRALAGALQAGDFPAQQAALRKISERMPEFLDAPELEAAIGEQLLNGLIGSPEEIENGDFKGHPFRGNQYPRGRAREGESKGFKRDTFGRIPSGEGENLSPRDNVARAKKAITWAFKNRAEVRGVIWRNKIGRVDLPVGRVGIIQDDFRHGEGLSHIQAKHPHDIDQMAATLSLGRITPAVKADGAIDPERMLLTHRGYLALIVKKPAESNSWILTHYHAPKK